MNAAVEAFLVLKEIKRDHDAAGAEGSCKNATGEEGEKETSVAQLSSVWVGYEVVEMTGESVQLRSYER